MNLDAVTKQAKQMAKSNTRKQLVSLFIECLSAGYVKKSTPAQLAIESENFLSTLDKELNLTKVISDDVLNIITAVISNRLMTVEETTSENLAKNLAILIKSLDNDLAKFYKS